MIRFCYEFENLRIRDFYKGEKWILSQIIMDKILRAQTADEQNFIP